MSKDKENFKICCTTEEITNITKFLTLDVMRETKNIFDEISINYNGDDWFWKKYITISSIYVMGYISGCRAIRKKHKGVIHNE